MPHERLISTIIPVFNRAALLRDAVESVLAQTYRPIEIIIVDDGSTDDTPEAIAALEAEHPDTIRAVRVVNGGPGLAREAGRQIAAGSFIQYLDSDDILLADKFALQVAGLDAHPECDVSYGKTHYSHVGAELTGVAWKRTGERIDTMFPSFLQSRWWGTSTPLYRRRIVDATGPWLGLRNEEDWEYDCRMAGHGVRLQFVDRFISHERDHAGGRLSRGGTRDSLKLGDRAKSHQLILQHALAAGVPRASAEMRHFSRAAFLLARQCGAAGRSQDADMLFRLAQETSEAERARGLDFKLFQLLRPWLGWALLGQASALFDAVRGRGAPEKAVG